ncbi:WXG100-like domain-containing protein [Kitasatospora sp. P5_F3]
MIQLPPDLAEVLKVIQSNENGKGITFPDSNEDLLAELATAWERWNSVAEPRINAIVANARLAMENMEGDAADSFARYLEKFSGGDSSHAATTVSAAVAIAQALRGSIEAVTQTKNEMIRELQYTKEYIEDNPAGKNDDIAKSEGIKEAATTYTTYVGQVGSNVDTMLRQGAGHFRQMTAAAEVAALPGAQGGSGSGGGPVPPPATTLDSVSGVTAPGPMTLQSYQGSPVGDTSGAVLPSGVPGGVSGGMPTGLAGGASGGALGGMPGGAVGGMPGGVTGGAGGGAAGGAPGAAGGGQTSRPTAALQPFRMPTAAAPAAFGAPSVGAGGVPAFKPQGAVAPGLQLAGHQSPEETKLALARSGVALRPFTPGGAESGGSLGGFSGGLGGLGGGAVGGRNTGGLAGRPGGLPGGSLTGRGVGGGGVGGAAGRGTAGAFAPGGRSAGGIGAGGGGAGGIGARSGGGGSALGAYSPGGGRSAGGVGGGAGGGAGSPVMAGGAGGGRGAGAGGAGSAHGSGGVSGGAGAGGVAGRGATGGVPGMPGMGSAGGGGGAGKSGGSRFVRPTRFGAEDDEEETVRSDAGILGQAVNHEPQDQHWQRMRRRWVEESGMAPSGELPQTVVAGTEQAGAPAAPAGTDLMSQLTAAMIGPETATTLNAPTEPASSAPAEEDAFLERSRSVAERRGRPDAEPVAEAPAAPPCEPAPILEEEGFQVPSPFMRSALARLASTGALPEAGGEQAAGQTAPAAQGR